VGLWWGTLYCDGRGRHYEDCLDGPGLLWNMVGWRVSFNPWLNLEPSLDNMLESSLAFWGAVGGMTRVGAYCAGF